MIQNKANIFEFFDEKKYLNSRGIRTKGSGENVGKNWIGIETCPYCQKSGYHFGINIYTKHVSCWTCGVSKSLPAFVMKTDKCNYETSISTIIKFSDGNIKINPRDLKRSYKVIMPTGIDAKFRKNFLDYIEGRGFSNPVHIQKKHGLLCTDISSEIPSRLVFPFFLHDEIVTLSHRTIYEKGYRNWSIEKSILDAKSTLYNIDSVEIGGDIAITEGAFDVLKGGDCFVGTSGSEWTFEQVQMILNKKPKRIFIIYDPDMAQKMAKELASTLSLFCDSVENILLTKHEDLGSMSQDDIKYLRKELGLN